MVVHWGHSIRALVQNEVHLSLDLLALWDPPHYFLHNLEATAHQQQKLPQ